MTDIPAAVVDGEANIDNPGTRDAYLASLIKRILRLGDREIDPKSSLLALGMDSIAAAELKATIAKDFKIDVPLESILQGVTLTELSALVGQQPQVIGMDKRRSA